jgi:hypothetical protein
MNRKRFFKKIVFLSCWAYGLDENHDLYRFNVREMELISKSNVKNIFNLDCGDYKCAFGIDLNGKLFEILDSEICYFDLNLQVEKIFPFEYKFFVNTVDKNTYYFCNYIGKFRSWKKTPNKFPYYLKKIFLYASCDSNDLSDTYEIYFAMDHNKQIYMWKMIPINNKIEKINCLGRNPRKPMIKLLNEYLPENIVRRPLSEEKDEDKINDVIKEFLYGKEEFTIYCCDKEVSVKMVYNSRDLKMATDRDGKVYLGEYHKSLFIDINGKLDRWVESPYFIEIKHKLKAKTKRKQQDKLFNLLKNGKNCDLSLNFFFSSSSSSPE